MFREEETKSQVKRYEYKGTQPTTSTCKKNLQKYKKVHPLSLRYTPGDVTLLVSLEVGEIPPALPSNNTYCPSIEASTTRPPIQPMFPEGKRKEVSLFPMFPMIKCSTRNKKKQRQKETDKK
jgi:hypothetical protein